MANTDNPGTLIPDGEGAGSGSAGDRGRARSLMPLQPIVRKKPRRRFRGVPPPLIYDLDALPDSAFLSDTETAAAVRRAKATLELWRTNANHPLKWRRVAGRVLYSIKTVRAFLGGADEPREPPAAGSESRSTAPEAGDRTPRRKAHSASGGAQERLSAPCRSSSEPDDRPRRRKARNAGASQQPTA
jgi:hypothetical protein